LPEEPSVPVDNSPDVPSEPPVVENTDTTTQEEITAIVDDVLSDGKLSAADSEAVLESLNADGEITKDEVNNLSETLAADGKLTTAEKELVAEALIESVAPGETLTKEQIQDAGIAYQDLPPETPVEVRQDENGNEVIISADVAAALVLLENPSELVGAIFSDPGQALQALGSIGADMSKEEREEATDMVVATVVAAGAAMNAVGAAAGSTGGSTGGSSSGGGSSGGGGASGDSKGVRRRRP
jgi:polyhydroxyalkanoate synthesis regulator phasin